MRIPIESALADLFDSYNSGLIKRFRTLGLDLTANHDVAAGKSPIK
jgi:hypothetical protein